jgi:hypothetical protein
MLIVAFTHPIIHEYCVEARSTSSPISNDHRPRLCFRRGYFVGLSIKLTASATTEATKGIGDGVVWHWRPSFGNLEAIVDMVSMVVCTTLLS